ncbi:hypothetical protein [Aureibaculum conchae]|uniref:hypothetical protein n=1 Tax=Aureibaculum sp. 2308TA14-22 TaxID=3108392 RepID=UPI0033940F52
MDNFEKHIKENKHFFDEHKADKAKLWATIESRLDDLDKKPKTIKLWNSRILKVAASIVIAIGLFSVINFFSNDKIDNQQNSVTSQELNDIDMHYKALVAHQVKLINTNSKLSEEDKHEFLLFMDELDQEYDVLKLELQKNLDSERILEAIVINYKKRIEIIENLLEQINNAEKINDDYGYTL